MNDRTVRDADLPIRILLVDDHTLFRRGLTALLSRDPGLQVVGDAADETFRWHDAGGAGVTGAASPCGGRACAAQRGFGPRPMIDIHVDVGTNRARRIIASLLKGDGA